MTSNMTATILGVLALFAASAPHASHANDAGQIARINGTPTITRDAVSSALHAGSGVQAGDIIETNAESKVKILFADDSILDIGPGSRVYIDAFALQPGSRNARVSVALGRFKLAIAKFFGGTTDYKVHTPTAVAGVRGTVLWGDTELDAICALDGTIEVRAKHTGKQATRVSAGACVHEMAMGKTAPLKPSPAALKSYLAAVTLD